MANKEYLTEFFISNFVSAQMISTDCPAQQGDHKVEKNPMNIPRPPALRRGRGRLSHTGLGANPAWLQGAMWRCCRVFEPTFKPLREVNAGMRDPKEESLMKP